MFQSIITEIISDNWPILAMFITTAIIFRYMYFKNGKQNLVIYKELMNLIFLVYIFILFTFLSKADLNTVQGINLLPFQEITRYTYGTEHFFYNVIGNIIIFVPMGFYLGYYANARKLGAAIFSVFIISSTVEIIQYFIGRAFDIDDIILNLAGTIIGYIIYMLFCKIKSILPNFMQKDGLYNAICIIIVIVLMLCFFNVLGVISF